MNRVKSLLFALLALLALGSFAVSSASAAPTSTSALLLTGGKFPVTFSSLPKEPNTIKSALQSTAVNLEGVGVLLQGSITSAAGGTYEVLFLKVTNAANGNTCKTLGEPVLGEILVPKNNFKLVHDISAENGAGILFEVNEFTIECGATEKVKVKGNVLGLLLPADKEILWLGGGASVECKNTTGGEPKEESYWLGLAGTKLTALLLANAGPGFKKACELIIPEAGLGTDVAFDVSEMIELML
jgi:hypothetical protein